MSKDQNKDLLTFLAPFGEEINDLVLWLRDFVWDLYPKTNELIYDNYNVVAFGWSLTDKLGHTFCSIAVGRTSKNVTSAFIGEARFQTLKKCLSAMETNTGTSLIKTKGISQKLISLDC